MIVIYRVDLHGLLSYYKAPTWDAKAENRRVGYNCNVIVQQILVR